jgi:PKD repeat protein
MGSRSQRECRVVGRFACALPASRAGRLLIAALVALVCALLLSAAGPAPWDAFSTSAPPPAPDNPSSAGTAASSTLSMGAGVSTTSPTFWSVVAQSASNTAFETNPGLGRYVNATPFSVFRYSMGTDECNVTANLQYNNSGVATSPCFINVPAFKEWCYSRTPRCTSLFDLPGENNNSAEDANIARYVVHTVGFQPTYWSVGNEPMLWTHYGIAWPNWRTTDRSTPTPIAYAYDVRSAILAVRAVDPGAQFIGIESDCQCSPTWFQTVAHVDGTLISAIAYHTYPFTARSVPETVQQLYNPLASSSNITSSYAYVRSTIAGQCSSCATMPIFVTEYNAGPGWSPSNLGGSYANAVFLAASSVQALRANVSMFTTFVLQTMSPSACGYALLTSNDVPCPPGVLYSELLSHLALGQTHDVSLQTSVPSVWPVLTENGSEESLLVVNANLTWSVNLSVTSVLPSGVPGTTYLWQRGEAAPVRTSGTVSRFDLIPPQGILLVDASRTLSTLTLSAQGNVTRGTAPLTVTFTATPLGGLPPYSYAWSFGDGASSSLPGPAHSYSAAGNYTATLTVRDSGGRVAVSSVPIDVLPPATPLVVQAWTNVMSGTIPLWAQLEANATGGTPPYRYSWELGNGSGSQSPVPTVLFTRPGNYSPTVTVTDSAGQTASASVPIFAVIPTGTMAAWALASTSAGPAPLTVHFVADATGGSGGYSYRWTFGDHATVGAGNAPAHQYLSTGNFTTELSIQDANGSQVQLPMLIRVYQPLSVSLEGIPAAVEANQTLSVAAAASGGTGSLAYRWSLNGAEFGATSTRLAWTPHAGGTDVVRVTVWDARGDQASGTATVHVLASTDPPLRIGGLLLPGSWLGTPTLAWIGMTVSAAGGVLVLLSRGRFLRIGFRW